MAKHGKKYATMIEKVSDQTYPLEDAVKLVKDTSYTSFPGSVELHLCITLPKDKEAKSIKGSLSLPHPTESKEVRIIVFCEKDIEEKARKAGATDAGIEELIKKIQDGWMDFDVALATPSVMGKIAILGKQLGPKGLMPNPKTGTLVEDVEKALSEFKKGKSKFSCDESGGVHLVVGKTGTEDAKIIENIRYTVRSVAETIGKPAILLVKGVALASTMGPGVRVAVEDVVE